MDQVSAELNRDAFWASREKSANATREIGSEYTAADVEDNHFNVVARFALTIAVTGQKERALTIKSQFMAHFHTKQRADERHASRFASSEAKIIFWPYFRQLVSDVTSRMHIPPVTIPLTLD
jgi:preprotein translocase subunit SecB